MSSARALDQERTARAVAPKQAHRALAGPELERVCFLVRLVVLRRRHLQHGALARGRYVGVPGERVGLAELLPPVGRHLPRDPLERDLVRKVLAQRSRSTTMAMPWPPPTHIVSSPIVPSTSSRSLSSVHMIRAPVMP